MIQLFVKKINEAQNIRIAGSWWGSGVHFSIDGEQVWSKREEVASILTKDIFSEVKVALLSKLINPHDFLNNKRFKKITPELTKELELHFEMSKLVEGE